MPIYEYECNKCNKLFEVILVTVDKKAEDTICPYCKNEDTSRLISKPSNYKSPLVMWEKTTGKATLRREDL